MGEKYTYQQKVLQNIKNTYNLDNVTYQFIIENYEKLHEKYKCYVPTTDYSITRKEDSMGIRYTESISKKYIDLLKLIINNDLIEINNWKQIKSCLRKDYIIDINLFRTVQECENVSLKEIGLLNLYANNLDNFKKYLVLLDDYDEETRTLILDIIKPFSFNINETSDLDSTLYSYIVNRNFHNDFKSLYIKGNYYLNIFFYYEFEYLFINFYDILANIVKKDNYKEMLRVLLKVKEYVYQNKPEVTGSKKEITNYEVVEYDSSHFKSAHGPCTQTRLKAVTELDVDFNNCEVYSLCNLVKSFFEMSVDEKIDYEKLYYYHHAHKYHVDKIIELLNKNESKVKKLCK